MYFGKMQGKEKGKNEMCFDISYTRIVYNILIHAYTEDDNLCVCNYWGYMHTPVQNVWEVWLGVNTTGEIYVILLNISSKG